MSINLTIDIYIYLLSNARSLYGKQKSKQLHFLCSPKHYWKISHISLQRGFHTSKIRCKWTKSEAHSCSRHCYSSSNNGLHGILKLSTSAPKGLTKVGIRMSRIKSALNSVSKAVFGNQNEMISRLAQFKPRSEILSKVSDGGWLKQKNIKQTIKSLKNYSDKSEKSSVLEKQSHVKDKDSGKQSPLPYTNSITTKFGESFYFLSNHINSYFKRDEKMSQKKENKDFQDKSKLEDKKGEEGKSMSATPGVLTDEKQGSESSSNTVDKPKSPSGTPEVLPVSTKKSIANFLSHPTEGVQALVGGYIGGLVPKFKCDSKSQSEEQEEATKAEQADSNDKNALEKKRLILQREKASYYSWWL